MSLREDCPTIYGPVRSRRHGLSLGINLGDPQSKACTWSCIYCQCGFGHRIEPSELRLIPSLEKVITELETALDHYPELNSVTMAGNTEPTSHPQFPQIVDSVLALREQRRGKKGDKWIFNALSNGSGLSDPNISAACDRLDEIWVKLDCGTESLFQQLNRPLPSLGSVEEHIHRIAKLKAPRLQILFWENPKKPELGNWQQENQKAILRAIELIRPRQVFVTTLQREPAMPELQRVNPHELEEFAREVRSLGFDVKVFV